MNPESIFGIDLKDEDEIDMRDCLRDIFLQDYRSKHENQKCKSRQFGL